MKFFIWEIWDKYLQVNILWNLWFYNKSYSWKKFFLKMKLYEKDLLFQGSQFYDKKILFWSNLRFYHKNSLLVYDKSKCDILHFGIKKNLWFKNKKVQSYQKYVIFLNKNEWQYHNKKGNFFVKYVILKQTRVWSWKICSWQRKFAIF